MKEAGRDIVLDDLTIRVTDVPLDRTSDVEYYRNKYLTQVEEVSKVNAELRSVQDMLTAERNANAGTVSLALVRDWLNTVRDGAVYSAVERINLIKAVRLLTYMGLKESKDLVESFITVNYNHS
jgi:ribosomal protein L7/L12